MIYFKRFFPRALSMLSGGKPFWLRHPNILLTALYLGIVGFFKKRENRHLFLDDSDGCRKLKGNTFET